MRFEWLDLKGTNYGNTNYNFVTINADANRFYINSNAVRDVVRGFDVFLRDEYDLSTLKKEDSMSNTNTGENEVLIFTYGTLKRGEGNHCYLQDAEFIGEAKLEGFEMYTNGSYPMIVEGEVHGEVFKIDEEYLEKVDRLEGYYRHNDMGMYLRRTETVIIEDEEVEVYFYKWNREVNAYDKVANGIF